MINSMLIHVTKYTIKVKEKFKNVYYSISTKKKIKIDMLHQRIH